MIDGAQTEEFDGLIHAGRRLRSFRFDTRYGPPGLLATPTCKLFQLPVDSTTQLRPVCTTPGSGSGFATGTR